MTTHRPPKKGGSGSGSGGSGSPRRGGRVRIWPLFLAMLLFPLFGLGLMALFAATADSTGFVGLLPLLAVGALLFGGALYFASRVTR